MKNLKKIFVLFLLLVLINNIQAGQTLTSPTLVSPTVSRSFTLENNIVYVADPMDALIIDTSELNNTKTITSDSVLTFSTPPSTGAEFGLQIINTDSSAHTITIPSSKSIALGGAARTTFVLAPSQEVTIKWRYEGSSVYTMWGDPTTILDNSSATPVAADSFEFYDVTDGLHKRALISTLITNWSDIGDATADGSIALGEHETDFTSTIDASGEAIITITNTDADAANDNSFIDLKHNDGGDANVFYLRMIGDADGTPTNDYLFSQAGFTSLLPVNVPAEAYDASGWNGDTGAPQKDGVRDQMELKANIASPTFTGDPIVPTASAGDNDTSAASTAFVNTQTRASNTGTHASPSTTNPLTLTFDAIMHAVWYGATGEIDLPAAASYTGRGFVVYNTGAFTVTLDPNGSEVIVRDGTVQTGGVTMTLSSGAGNYVALISDGARWITLGFKGTLAAGS